MILTKQEWENLTDEGKLKKYNNCCDNTYFPENALEVFQLFAVWRLHVFISDLNICLTKRSLPPPPSFPGGVLQGGLLNLFITIHISARVLMQYKNFILSAWEIPFWPSYLHNWISCTLRMASLYWIRPLATVWHPTTTTTTTATTTSSLPVWISNYTPSKVW